MLIPADPAPLKHELIAVRDVGLRKLDEVAIPGLLEAARLVTLDRASPDAVVIETLIRRAVHRLGGGTYGDAASALFGLAGGLRGSNSKLRREAAGRVLDRSFETFRKNYESPLLDDIVRQVGILVSEQHTRDAREQSQGSASRDTSNLPQLWHERFAAYHRIWTPINGLAADLTAYRATLLEHERSWDRRFGTEGKGDPGYSQEDQAEGYALFALYHYAMFSWELRRFSNLHGGQWLLSDLEAEQAVADAVHTIWKASPWNERDDSYLRSLLDQTPEQEMHGFITALRSEEIGRVTEQEWYEWCGQCQCSCPSDLKPASFFPSRGDDDSIKAECPVHQLVAACCVYLSLIEEDWKRLADWYRGH